MTAQDGEVTPSLGVLETAGERLAIKSQLRWVSELIREGAAGELRVGGSEEPTLEIVVESTADPFAHTGMEPLTRDAWSGDRTVLMVNACGTGFDMLCEDVDGAQRFTFRWRPPTRERLAAKALRARFILLARAVLLQYPALWVAGTNGRAPLHAPAVSKGSFVALLAGPSGVGKSTLLSKELDLGAWATSDNVSVGDGVHAWGLVEPMRIEGGTGRRMYHGRSEAPLTRRAPRLEPERVVVVRRGDGTAPVLTALTPDLAERALITGTFMAGELRRYWAFAATLAAGTGRGPSHPPLREVARSFTEHLPCFQIILPATPDGLPASPIAEMENACR
jgi:hypothetical protein